MTGIEAFAGGCQCGRCRYRVRGEALALFVCHCTECQRQSSSAFGMALWLTSHSTLATGSAWGRWVRDTPAGKRLVGELCRVCGTRLFHQMAGQSEVLSIKPGTLDAAATRGLEPVAHIWTRSAVPWMRFPEGSLLYRENPPSFDAIFAAWRARGR